MLAVCQTSLGVEGATATVESYEEVISYERGTPVGCLGAWRGEVGSSASAPRVSDRGWVEGDGVKGVGRIHRPTHPPSSSL